MSKLNKTEQLFRTLPADVQYDIDMQLFDEFNNMHIYVDNEIFNGRLPQKERTYWNREETRRKRELTERWLKENDE